MAGGAVLRGETGSGAVDTVALVALNAACAHVCASALVDAATRERVRTAVERTLENWGDLPSCAKETVLVHLLTHFPNTRGAAGVGALPTSVVEAFGALCERHSMREVDDATFCKEARSVYSGAAA